MGYMTVVIPPDIMDETSEEPVAQEGGNIKLRCVATGSPEPNVTWKREDGRAIVLRENGQKKRNVTFSTLNLRRLPAISLFVHYSAG